MKATIVAVVAALLAAGCATRTTVQPGKDCGFPLCTVSVRVVDDGQGGKKLDLEGDGNIRMLTRHRLTAIMWKLQTDGYEFRGNSIHPHTGQPTPGKETTAQGAWDRQLIQGSTSWDTFYVTNLNTERATLYYDITVYPSYGTAGPPIRLDPAIFNDP